MYIIYNGSQFTNFTIYNYDNGEEVNLTTISDTTAKAKAEKYMRDFLHDLQRYYADARTYAWSVYVQKELVVSAVCTEKPNWKYNGAYPYEFKYDEVNNGLQGDIYATDWTDVGDYTSGDEGLRYNAVAPDHFVTLRNMYIRKNNSRTGANQTPFEYVGLAG
jgi:hypothetical protein